MHREDKREAFSSSLGGAISTVIEYPLDTIKVRLQDDGKRYGSALKCIKSIYQDEGVLNGFFRGLPAPVIGFAVESATLFLAYRKALESYQQLVYGRVVEQDTESYDAVGVSGSCAGLVVAQALTPAELIKCRMQIQNTLPVKERIYKNSFECFLTAYMRRGIRGLFRGHVAMLYREAIGCFFYFLAFQSVVRSFLLEDQKFTDASTMVHFLAGGCAGTAFWTSIYPIDIIKTKQQAKKADYRKRGFLQSCAWLYRKEGLRGFYRGYCVTVFRAFPGNAVFIAVYEQMSYIWDVVHRTSPMHTVHV
ncbi:unnamed protein product [Phytomonas sp. Hart1]|nr:unnamed protein product [Phytomonas sp. Hart1]|eukprot:CCW70848.1 unnamed protein product [Phytomonas sp. isolate Hart1]